MNVWTCQDGRKIPVSEMETSHVQNSLRMLRRKGFISTRTLEAYMCTPDLADGAMMCFEQEQDRAFRAPVSDFVDIFASELERRGAKELPL